MFLTVFFICIFLGSMVGFLSGLLGIGGGLVIVPALNYLLPMLNISTDLVMPMALATSLATIAITSFSSAYVHHRNSNIPWPLTKQLMVTVAIGALVGSFVAHKLSSEALTTIFSSAVIILASYMLLSIRIDKTTKMPNDKIMQLVGVITGGISSLMGIAGGAILIPVLSYCGLSVRHAIGVATACGFTVALFGTLGYILTGVARVDLPPWCFGYIYLPALLGMTLTSSFFAPIGVKFAAKLPVQTLKKFFALFLILVATKMIWS